MMDSYSHTSVSFVYWCCQKEKKREKKERKKEKKERKREKKEVSRSGHFTIAHFFFGFILLSPRKFTKYLETISRIGGVL